MNSGDKKEKEKEMKNKIECDMAIELSTLSFDCIKVEDKIGALRLYINSTRLVFGVQGLKTHIKKMKILQEELRELNERKKEMIIEMINHNHKRE